MTHSGNPHIPYDHHQLINSIRAPGVCHGDSINRNSTALIAALFLLLVTVQAFVQQYLGEQHVSGVVKKRFWIMNVRETS